MYQWREGIPSIKLHVSNDMQDCSRKRSLSIADQSDGDADRTKKQQTTSKSLFLDEESEDDEITTFLNSLAPSDVEDTDNDESSISEEENLSADEWEDVDLNDNIVVRTTIDRDSLMSKEEQRKESAKKKANQKRRLANYLKTLKFKIHIAMMPILISTLKTRMEWCTDKRLNKRLKRSVPKPIAKKFKKWDVSSEDEKEKSTRTLLLGLVHWFRNNYKINSNGFRQNSSRLDLLSSAFASSFESIPDNTRHIYEQTKEFYGDRPLLSKETYEGTDEYEGIISNVRQMARKMKANRDILALFFFIILKNILPGDYKLSLCFSLPLMDYDSANTAFGSNIDITDPDNNVETVPNRFDTDLLHPYFWIELSFNDQEIYVIDPVVHTEPADMVAKYSINDPVPGFEPRVQFRIKPKQHFHYVIRMDYGSNYLTDVSPRYISNLYYRYFDLPFDSSIKKSRQYISNKHLTRWIDAFNRSTTPSNNTSDTKENFSAIAQNHVCLPQTLQELKRSNNFIAKDLLRKSQILKLDERCRTMKTTLNHKISDEIDLYWKNQVINLKSRQHWLILGRTVRQGESALKLKKEKIRSLHHVRNNSIEIRELFSWDQTIPTVKLPNSYVDENNIRHKITDVRHYKNKYGNVEIYLERNIPNGFHFVSLRDGVDVKALIKKYNKSVTNHRAVDSRVRYIGVVSGFDFTQKHGYAVPVIDKIMVNDRDYLIVDRLVKEHKEVEALGHWHHFLTRVKIKDQIDREYGHME